MTQRTATQTPQQVQTTPTPASSILQRKCACGNHTVAGGECAECAKKTHGLQRKLAIGASNDPLEREAERVADQVMAAPTHPAVDGAPPRIQRCTGQAIQGMETAPASVDHALASAGRPLEPALRQDMEQRFGHDFSQVRMHSGTAAEQSARDVNAHAYTVGHDIMFGAGQYAPNTARGRQVLAHELTHVVQQGGGLADGKIGARLQRLSFSDVLEEGASAVLGPVVGDMVRLVKQPIDDLVASIKESPQHVGEFLKDEVWESIKNHWLQIMVVTGGLIAAEMAVGVLMAVPEPTLLIKVIAVILQIAIIAIIGYFAAVEVKGAYEEGGKWLSTAKRANGDPKIITEASRSFVRMIWHIIMAILAIAGVRARVRGAAIPKVGGTAGSGTSAGTAAAGEGGTVTPISSHPRFQARSTPPTSGQPSASAFGPRGTARQLAPAERPLVEPQLPTPAPTPVAAKSVPATSSTGPGVQPGSATAVGIAAATNEKKHRKAKAYPLIWPIALHYPTQVEFARVKSPDRDYAGENQKALKAKRKREEGDPDFQSEKYHIHHVVPLFLGGRDALQSPAKGGNGIILPGRQHLSGHRQLQIQPQMEHPSPPLPPLNKDIYKHPIGTLYYLADFKAKKAEIGEE